MFIWPWSSRPSTENVYTVGLDGKVSLKDTLRIWIYSSLKLCLYYVITFPSKHSWCCTLKYANVIFRDTEDRVQRHWEWLCQPSCAHLEPFGVSERSQRSLALLPVQDILLLLLLLLLVLLPLLVVVPIALLWREDRMRQDRLSVTTLTSHTHTQTHRQQGWTANY